MVLMATPANPLAGRRFVDEAGNPVVPGRKLGEGGEGVVHQVEGDPGSVVKIWHPGKAPRDAHAKIRHLVRNPVTPDLGVTWQITWPRRMVMESGTIVGYTMPILNRAENWEAIVEYYNRRAAQGTGKAQAREIQIDDRVRMARNLALGFKAVHEAGYVIGDVNEKNVEVNRQNDIAMVDCDSYGFTDPNTGQEFSNNMGRPEFQAPEAQGDYTNRTQEQDLFGLAVVIFHLLTGYHPYTVNNQPDYALPGERISNWLFAPAGRGVTAPDPYNEVWDALTDRQKELFLRVFDKDHEGEPRPKPEEWVEALMEIPAVAPAPSPAPGPAPTPTPPGAPPRPGPAPASPGPTPRRYYTPPGSEWPLWVSAVAGYGVLIPLSIFDEFRPWWWLSLLLIAGLLLYFPAKRLLSRPISIVRWILIVLASIVFGTTLLSAAMNTWPWWLWLATGLGMAFILLVPARDRLLGLLRGLSVGQRRIAIGGVSLLGVGAAIIISMIALANLGTDGSGASAGNAAGASSGTSGGNGASVPLTSLPARAVPASRRRQSSVMKPRPRHSRTQPVLDKRERRKRHADGVAQLALVYDHHAHGQHRSRRRSRFRRLHPEQADADDRGGRHHKRRLADPERHRQRDGRPRQDVLHLRRRRERAGRD